jgi:hypothetical protein
MVVVPVATRLLLPQACRVAPSLFQEEQQPRPRRNRKAPMAVAGDQSVRA